MVLLKITKSSDRLWKRVLLCWWSRSIRCESFKISSQPTFRTVSFRGQIKLRQWLHAIIRSWRYVLKTWLFYFFENMSLMWQTVIRIRHTRFQCLLQQCVLRAIVLSLTAPRWLDSAASWHHPGGGLNKVLYGEVQTHTSCRTLLYTIFDRKGTSFSYIFHINGITFIG